jgi:hypothetical protein
MTTRIDPVTASSLEVPSIHLSPERLLEKSKTMGGGREIKSQYNLRTPAHRVTLMRGWQKTVLEDYQLTLMTSFSTSRRRYPV